MLFIVPIFYNSITKIIKYCLCNILLISYAVQTNSSSNNHWGTSTKKIVTFIFISNSIRILSD